MAGRADIGARNQADMKALSEMLETLDVAGKCSMVKMCRADKMYKEGLTRISLAITDMAARKLVIDSLAQLGAERKFGMAPRTNQERELQLWLESFLAES